VIEVRVGVEQPRSAPPFAGQGLVAGLRDAANLAWKLAWVLRGQADPRVLDSYDEERRPHARKIIRLARILGAIVMPQSRAAAFVAHGLVSLLRLVVVRKNSVRRQSDSWLARLEGRGTMGPC
jgi:2-polyprenyl-6-methoxyphenol hydroxylase-like FAD-dependent oxidoreductase